MGNCAGKKVEGQPVISLDKLSIGSSMDSERNRLSSMSVSEQREFMANEMMNRELDSGI